MDELAEADGFAALYGILLLALRYCCWLARALGCADDRLEVPCVSKVGARDGWRDGAPEYVLKRASVRDAIAVPSVPRGPRG